MSASRGNLQEIKLMRLITDELLLTKKSKHFAAVHKYTICDKSTLKSYQGANIKMPSKLKLVSINELAHGDLKTLINTRDIAGNDNLMLNLLFQVFISIGTFQNVVKYVHNDSHFGNFLYQKNNEKGYYEYLFNGKKYYLKGCGYNMMIYDFGISKDISTDEKLVQYGNLIPIDYARIIHAFLSKMYGWGEYYDLPNKKCENIVLNMKKALDDIRINCQYNKDEKTPMNIFNKILNEVLIPFTPADMFLTTKPKGTIINSTPYIIG